jgi:hypothetical protein
MESSTGMTAPPTSGTYTWFPPFSDVIIAAYGRCQVRREMIGVDHLFDAAMAANLLQVDWSNEQVNLWTVDLQITDLIPGVATYDVDPATVMIMAAYLSIGDPAKDRIITSIDRDSYASFPDKDTPGRPTVYWFNHQIEPTITLWQPPDDAEPYTLKYFRARQIADASAPGGITPEVPYRFLEAYVAGLAFKLAELYAPARMNELAQRAVGSFTKAKNRDVENSPLRIVPAMSIYASAVY